MDGIRVAAVVDAAIEILDKASRLTQTGAR
jgi:hypothetical protein